MPDGPEPEQTRGVDIPSVEPLSVDEIQLLGENLLERVATGEISLEEAKEQQRQLIVEAAGFDPFIEGLHNKGWFNQRLEQEISRSRREQSSLSIVTIDLDGFKEVNDQAGHSAGDETLQHVGIILLEMAKRGVDAVARMGGDEFSLLMPGTDSIHSLVVAIRTLQTIPTISPVDQNTGMTLPVTASIGVTEFDLHNKQETAKSFLERADQALKAAKIGGKNSICLSVTNDSTFSMDKLEAVLLRDVRIAPSEKAQTIADIVDHTILIHK